MDLIYFCLNNLNPSNRSFNASTCDDPITLLVNLTRFFENITVYVNFINLFVLSIIMLMILCGRIKEDYKWFVLNWSVWNFLAAFSFIFAWLFPKIKQQSQIWLGGIVYKIVYIYGTNMCIFMVLPIIFSRFVALYFPKLYDIVFYRKISYFFVILAYDAIWFFIIWIITNFQNSWINLAVMFFNDFAIIVLSSLLISKIHRMLKLVGSDIVRKETYKDLQRAATMCFLEGLVGFLLNANYLYLFIFQELVLYFDGSNFHVTLVKIYLVADLLALVFIFYACLVDCFLTLYMIKSYRKNIILLAKLPYFAYLKYYKKTPVGTSSNKLFVPVTPFMYDRSKIK